MLRFLAGRQAIGLRDRLRSNCLFRHRHRVGQDATPVRWTGRPDRLLARRQGTDHDRQRRLGPSLGPHSRQAAGRAPRPPDRQPRNLSLARWRAGRRRHGPRGGSPLRGRRRQPGPDLSCPRRRPGLHQPRRPLPHRSGHTRNEPLVRSPNRRRRATDPHPQRVRRQVRLEERPGEGKGVCQIAGTGKTQASWTAPLLSDRFGAIANGVVRYAPTGLPPRRGTTNQPRATPWVGEPNTIGKP